MRPAARAGKSTERGRAQYAGDADNLDQIGRRHTTVRTAGRARRKLPDLQKKARRYLKNAAICGIMKA